jgi:hypothetical protein
VGASLWVLLSYDSKTRAFQHELGVARLRLRD